MQFEEFVWVQFGLLVYIFGVVVQATNNSILHDVLIPSKKRHMFDRNRSHHTKNTNRNADERETIECCPSVTRAIAPLGGVARDGSLVELFRDSNTTQIFYETACASGVKGNPCNFVKGSKWKSRCEEKFTYTYAIVKNFKSTEPYRVDYIKIKSGCSCSIQSYSRHLKQILSNNTSDKHIFNYFKKTVSI